MPFRWDDQRLTLWHALTLMWTNKFLSVLYISLCKSSFNTVSDKSSPTLQHENSGAMLTWCLHHYPGWDHSQVNLPPSEPTGKNMSSLGPTSAARATFYQAVLCPGQSTLSQAPLVPPPTSLGAFYTQAASCRATHYTCKKLPPSHGSG